MGKLKATRGESRGQVKHKDGVDRVCGEIPGIGVILQGIFVEI